MQDVLAFSAYRARLAHLETCREATRLAQENVTPACAAFFGLFGIASLLGSAEEQCCARGT